MRQHVERDKITLKSHLLQPKIIIPPRIRHHTVNNLSTTPLNVLPILKLMHGTEENIPLLLIHKFPHPSLIPWGKINLQTPTNPHTYRFSFDLAELLPILSQALEHFAHLMHRSEPHRLSKLPEL